MKSSSANACAVQSPRKDPHMCFTRSGQRPARSSPWGAKVEDHGGEKKRGKWREKERAKRTILQILRPPGECAPPRRRKKKGGFARHRCEFVHPRARTTSRSLSLRCCIIQWPRVYIRLSLCRARGA